MTVTAIAPEATEAPTVAVFAAHTKGTGPQEVADLLRTVAVFADTGKYALPVLESVQLESDGRTITARATDRYALAEATFEATDHAPFTALVSARQLTAALKATVSARSAMLRLWPNADGSVTFDNHDGTSFTVPAVGGEFPRVAQLWPAPSFADSLPYTAVGISVGILTKLAKVTKSGILRFELSPKAHNGVAVVTATNVDGLRILVMMARVDA